MISRSNAKQPKYRNKKVVRDGLEFDSVKEWKRWTELLSLEKAGAIQNLQRQVKYQLIPSQRIDGKVAERAVTYVADYVYEKDGEVIVEDVKGYRGGGAYKIFTLKRKLMLWVHHIRIIEV